MVSSTASKSHNASAPTALGECAGVWQHWNTSECLVGSSSIAPAARREYGSSDGCGTAVADSTPGAEARSHMKGNAPEFDQRETQNLPHAFSYKAVLFPIYWAATAKLHIILLPMVDPDLSCRNQATYQLCCLVCHLWFL